MYKHSGTNTIQDAKLVKTSSSNGLKHNYTKIKTLFIQPKHQTYVYLYFSPLKSNFETTLCKHSVKFVKIAATKPNTLLFKSYELHNANPNIIGNRLTFVQKPVISPINKREIITVNNGDDDFIVSTNEIDECLSAIRHRIIEINL